jgi:hypothetical protein
VPSLRSSWADGLGWKPYEHGKNYVLSSRRIARCAPWRGVTSGIDAFLRPTWPSSKAFKYWWTILANGSGCRATVGPLAAGIRGQDRAPGRGAVAEQLLQSEGPFGKPYISGEKSLFLSEFSLIIRIEDFSASASKRKTFWSTYVCP